MTKFFAWPGFRWLAVTILLIAYILVSQGVLEGKGIAFNVLNCLGSLLMIANSLSLENKDWPVAVFNMVWVAIALFTVFKIFI